MDTYIPTLFEGEAWGLVLIVGSSKKLDPTPNTSPESTLALNPTKMIINHILSWIHNSKAGALPPCWDLVT